MAHPSHNTRLSDSSLHDEVCTACGGQTYRGTAHMYSGSLVVHLFEEEQK